jgi:dipeptidyl aminopeptidase/acylaminoacyl peptidase
VDNAVTVSRFPRIRPDYSEIVIPPNIAPLNFAVRERGRRFVVRIRCEAGEEIEIVSNSTKIRIPQRRWRLLLEANRGKDLLFDVYAEVDGQWQRYQTIVNRIARDDIDGHIAYRLIGPIHTRWRQIGVYQRDLTTYKESAVLDGVSLDGACVNCHSFASNDPNRMFVGVRSRKFGGSAVLVADGKAEKIGTKFGYTAWHPSGRVAAYSINKTRQFFHTAGAEVRDVVDLDSALAYYSVEMRNVKMVPGASDKQRLETYPTWSPDGRYLYYCSAPFHWTDRNAIPSAHYAKVRYDLMRISYDIDADKWGQPETVLSAQETELSILMPRISPDGKFLLFCMCRYGCFPIHQTTSDLYMMDLATGQYARLAVNSEFSESWHSWSSNSRWIAFSSRRRGGYFTRCYISFVDGTGRVHKPFILPQSDPSFYDSYLKTVSVPELITGPVPLTSETVTRAARSGNVVAVDAIAGASPSAGVLDPWRQPEP